MSAGAALTGLVFVALSINLRQILGGPGLPARTGEAIVGIIVCLLVGVLDAWVLLVEILR